MSTQNSTPAVREHQPGGLSKEKPKLRESDAPATEVRIVKPDEVKVPAAKPAPEAPKK